MESYDVVPRLMTATAVAQTTDHESPPPSPSWGDSETSSWMYCVPDRADSIPLWADEWADFLLEWTERMRVHLVTVSLFITKSPFNEILDKQRAFQIIGERLVEKGVAQWVGEKSNHLRVYWRPFDEWPRIIYEWAIKTGNTRLDIKSVMIQETNQAFATLPEKELRDILTMLVQEGLAEWIDKKRYAIKLRL